MENDDIIYEGGILPEVTITAPRKYIAGYDNKGNRIYTYNPKESMGYNTINPHADYIKSMEALKSKPKYTDAFVKAAQIGIGAPLAVMGAGPLFAASQPVLDIFGRPLTNTTKVASKIFPNLSKALPYTEMADRGLMGYLGATDMYNTAKNWYNGETPWYLAAPLMALSGAMVADAAPVVSNVISKVIPKGTRRQIHNFLFPKEHADFQQNLDSYLVAMSDLYRKLMKERELKHIISHYLPQKGEDRASRYLYTTGFKSSTPRWTTEQAPITVSINGHPIKGQKTIKITQDNNRLEPIWDQPSPLITDWILGVPSKIYRPKDIWGLPMGDVRIFDVENTPEFNEAIRQHIMQLQQQTGYPVVGSSRLISEGYFGGVPGDVEVIVPKDNLAEAIRKLRFDPLRKTRGGTGQTGYSPIVMEGPEKNNLDINVLDRTGTIIHQLESTRNPDNMPPYYSLGAKQQARQNPTEKVFPSAAMGVYKPTQNGELSFAPYSSKEYFDLIKNDGDLLTQSVVDNVFKSHAPKHISRAFTMMNNSNPQVINRVSTAIDHMVAQIPGMRRFSSLYKSQKFDNVEENKKILEKIGFLPFDVEEMASNPEMMKNVVDYWYMRKTVGTRSVNFDPRLGGTFEDVMTAVRSYDNGSASGGGGNTILGNTFGGYTRNYTSYTYYAPQVDRNTATFNDVYEAFEREKNIWSQTDEVVKAIEAVLPKYNLKISDFTRFDSNFTDDVTRAVQAGKLTNKEADELIMEVAKELKVSGYRGKHYGHLSSGRDDYGDYFGGMQRPEPNNETVTAYRNIDWGAHNQPILPAEFGSDQIFFRGKESGQSQRLQNLIPDPFELYTDEEIQRLLVDHPYNIVDLESYDQQVAAIMPDYKQVIQEYQFSFRTPDDQDVGRAFRAIDEGIGLNATEHKLNDVETIPISRKDKAIDRYQRIKKAQERNKRIGQAIGKLIH